MLTIGRIAAQTGTTPDTLRYYEREGLMPAPTKGANGYRLYPPAAVKQLVFIRQAQACGFSLAEIRQLQAMPALEDSCCADVRQLAIDKKGELEAKVAVMQSMTKELDRLITDCAARERSLVDCPILRSLQKAPAAVDDGPLGAEPGVEAGCRCPRP